MTSNSSLPWLMMNDFLAEVGAAENDQEFIRLVMQRIEYLVPYDIHCVFGVIAPQGQLCESKSVVESEKWFQRFKDKYWRLQPDVSKETGINTKVIDWNSFRDTEYATDFIAPQYIRYSLGVLAIGKGYLGTLALNRSKTSPQFNERERWIMEALQPHLSNFYRIITQLDQKWPTTPNAAELADGYPCLTKREAEITAMICQRYSSEMIQSKLFISRLTVYKHIEHIFEKLNVSSRTELVAKLLGPQAHSSQLK